MARTRRRPSPFPNRSRSPRTVQSRCHAMSLNQRSPPMWSPDPSQIITREQREAESLERAWAALRAERDRLLAETDGPFLRHLSQREAGLPLTLTEEQFADLVVYQQALRDLPE